MFHKVSNLVFCVWLTSTVISGRVFHKTQPTMLPAECFKPQPTMFAAKCFKNYILQCLLQNVSWNTTYICCKTFHKPQPTMLAAKCFTNHSLQCLPQNASTVPGPVCTQDVWTVQSSKLPLSWIGCTYQVDERTLDVEGEFLRHVQHYDVHF